MSVDIVITRKLSLSCEEAYILAEWQNDPSIAHLLRPNFEELELPIVTTEEVMRVFQSSTFGRQWYFGYLNGKLVGECSFQIDPPMLHNPIPKTAWPGVCVGDEKARSKGLGKELMNYLEIEASAVGARRIELGVFEFNHRALSFYNSLGYRKIDELTRFTYWNGTWWSDIRMEKWLV